MAIKPIHAFKIKVGTGLKTASNFEDALVKAGCTIDESARMILHYPAFSVASNESDIYLVAYSTIQLAGKKSNCFTEDLYEGAARLGLEECMPEDGPQLRLQFLGQQYGINLRIGMRPIVVNPTSGSLVFTVEHNEKNAVISDDSLRLSTALACSGGYWHYSHELWVFRCPQ
ncbi:MAG: hypothetical protein ABH871_10350 [Pseudomonadota bacterium]